MKPAYIELHKKKKVLIFIFLGFIITQCNIEQQDNKDQAGFSSSEKTLMTRLQKQTFNYFWEGAEPVSGMARERIHMDGIYPQNDQDIVTTGGTGFGLMAILVGIERSFISREKALKRYQKIVNFLEKADRFLKYLYNEADSLVGKYGPYDAYSHEYNWSTPRYLSIDKGPIPVMIENYRTGILWDLFMSAPEIQKGLDKLGFTYK